MSAKPTPTKNEQLQGQTLAIRAIESTLKIAVANDHDKRFLVATLKQARPIIPTLPPGLLVRLYGAVCESDFPDSSLVDFRYAVQACLAPFLGIMKSQPTKSA